MSAGAERGAAVPLAALAGLSVAVVLHDRAALRAFAPEHADAGADERLREALLQCHLFCGIPRTLAALDALADAGLRLAPDAGTRGADADPEEPRRAGAAVFDRIYGDGADDVRAHLARLDPTFERWVAEHAYGRVLSRPGLDAAERELLAVAMLAATGHERQLASHARGAVRCGAAPEEVAAVLEAVAGPVDPERLSRAREVVARFARP